MASLTLQNLQIPLRQKSHFLGQKHLFSSPQKLYSRIPNNMPSTFILKPAAKFNLSEIMGGRGLCNGEQGLQQELNKTVEASPSTVTEQEKSGTASPSNAFKVPDNGFEKELLGLTGGFPGGEKGLNSFIEKNPPPKKSDSGSTGELGIVFPSSKPKPPELPLLMPGMIAIVKNPKNPFYMYCGIIQRITDGMAGVLFEGGNWDKLITFRLDELERREKGPPMVNPKSAILEGMVQKDPVDS
ncbi:hypothetical protein HHK36_020987 [Tetracentron sinense]|uniref:Chlororespiratory reduction31 n=1 Tax=Tetracentron sinense TaxID=13715 RepID=A0A835DBJ8_TETSI|nr:hypothetical protein HHK36_020987 [Tetracentron sinense]